MYFSKVFVIKICTYYVNEYYFWSTNQILANEVSN